MAGFADKLFHSEVEEAVNVIGLQYHRRIGTSSSAADANNLLISPYQSSIGCQNRNGASVA